MQVVARHLPESRSRQRIGRCIEPLQRIAQFMVHDQAQMPLGQRQGCIAHHGTEPLGRVAQAVFEHDGMAGRRYPVGQHAGKTQAFAVMLQAPSQRAKSAGHRAGINHCNDIQAKALRQIGGARLAVKQPHHAFDNDEIGVLRGIVQTLRAVRLAGHPEV